jgi:hypothetical protein
MRVIEGRVLAVLGEDGTELSFILAIGFHNLGHWHVRVLGDVAHQLLVRNRQLLEVWKRRHGVELNPKWYISAKGEKVR